MNHDSKWLISEYTKVLCHYNYTRGVGWIFASAFLPILLRWIGVQVGGLR